MAHRALKGLWKFMGEEIKKVLLHFSTDKYSETYHKIAELVLEQEFTSKFRAQV